MSVRILGIRGIPARHGGFESFAEDLSIHLSKRGWNVTVYCQEDGAASQHESVWRGVRRIHIPVRQSGAWGTIVFDWKATCDAARTEGLVLVLGYNTALFSFCYRLRGIPNALNMDGLEWKRQKYNIVERAWFLINERLGQRFADHLIADHPAIGARLIHRANASRVSVIPYGARKVSHGDLRKLEPFGLAERGYALLVARPEPENSILQIVRAFEVTKRAIPLIVLGKYDRAVTYERRVLEAAGEQVRFLGPIYDHDTIDALRFHARLYLHGHTVGGTNPALVEALGAGLPIIAHDNVFNRWFAGEAGEYFLDERSCACLLDRLLESTAEDDLTRMRREAILRHTESFSLEENLDRYESVLRGCRPARSNFPRRARAARASIGTGVAALLCFATFACSSGVATRRIQAIPALVQTAEDLAAGAQELTPGDVLAVSYPYRPEYNRDLVVRPDGRITLPQIGPVPALGRSVEELQTEVNRAYANGAYSPSAQSGERHYLINVGDELEIRFREAQALNTTVKVRPDGRISLALVKSFVAEGKSPEQLERELIDRYRNELTNPDLVVIVKEFTSDRVYVNGRLLRPGAKDLDEAEISMKVATPRQVYVAGEVRTPGIVPYQAGLSALQAIAAVGGTPRTAQMNNVLVLRRVPNQRGQAVFMNLRDDIAGRSTNDISLRPFDVVIVPKTGIARLNDFLDQYLYQLLPISRNVNFSFFYDLRNGGGRFP